ncbi:hypothetical protein VPH35_075901 [Triticum aestivum]
MANPPDPISPPMNRYLNFQSVQMEHIYHRCWIIRAKGTKIEAIAFSNQAYQFNAILQTGLTYDFSSVGINPTEMLDGHFWYLCMEFVIELNAITMCTENLFEKIAVTYIQLNRRDKCLETMRESTFLFSPDSNDDVHHLQDIHEACLMTLDETLSYVNAAVVARKNGQ